MLRFFYVFCIFDYISLVLSAAREKINAEFAKNRSVADADKVKELITFAQQVEEVLRTSVIQAVRKEDGLYRAKIREETTKLDNKPYQPMPESMIGPFKKKTKCID
ncbi:complex III assembly factor LYRM7-like [Panulirus ornatus]|uniref:complex III assembly factor LYRM7-like n=1 Tax=Panulirus ornatus TaxID=150431 RepID=UPI003A8AD488